MKKLSLALLALFAATVIAIAGGTFQGLPVVGNDGTICLSNANPTSAVTCNQFQPLGPAQVPPNSYFPADTNIIGQNGNPYTVDVPTALTGANVLDNVPLTGATIAIPNGTNKLMLNPAGTIAALTVTLPAATSPPIVDGTEFFIYSSQTVTALTVTPGTGTTLTPTITTVTAAAPVKLIYSGQTKAWQLF